MPPTRNLSITSFIYKEMRERRFWRIVLHISNIQRCMSMCSTWYRPHGSCSKIANPRRSTPVILGCRIPSRFCKNDDCAPLKYLLNIHIILTKKQDSLCQLELNEIIWDFTSGVYRYSRKVLPFFIVSSNLTNTIILYIYFYINQDE